MLQAAQLLEERGVEAEVVKLNIITPLDAAPVLDSVRRTGALLVAEDSVSAGSVGERLACALEQAGISARVALCSSGVFFTPHGSVGELKRLLELDGAGWPSGPWRCCDLTKQRLDVELTAWGLAESRQKRPGHDHGRAGLCGWAEGGQGGHPGGARLCHRGAGQDPGLCEPGGTEAGEGGGALAHPSGGGRCADIGSSTGGFTDCMLQRGAEKVYAVDSGYNQLDWRLRSDPRVVCMERTNARYLTGGADPGAPGLLLRGRGLHLSPTDPAPPCAPWVGGGAQAVCLVKPQFEAGREKVGQKRVVRDPAVHLEVLEHFLDHAREADFL